ncbi:hypothetical protein ACFTWF_31235, partial [Rhodococcus sp. NPDC056960]|uniref:hypothetical protein n=1 Tax=Rhodococcus sp. NPDC056960 TaxID=3345982 RepID=UPI00363757F3
PGTGPTTPSRSADDHRDHEAFGQFEYPTSPLHRSSATTGSVESTDVTPRSTVASPAPVDRFRQFTATSIQSIVRNSGDGRAERVTTPGSSVVVADTTCGTVHISKLKHPKQTSPEPQTQSIAPDQPPQRHMVRTRARLPPRQRPIPRQIGQKIIVELRIAD